MDISAVDVPEEDFDRVRQMQMSTMEWDESGEAALKKGFRKGTRTKFMGEGGLARGGQGADGTRLSVWMCCSLLGSCCLSHSAIESVPLLPRCTWLFPYASFHHRRACLSRAGSVGLSPRLRCGRGRDNPRGIVVLASRCVDWDILCFS